MYQHGDWVSVPVDDRMPIMQDGTPVFARTKKEEGEVWPMLIEKAWVKAWAKGDYQAVAGGRPAHALHAFTGAPCEEVRTRQRRVHTVLRRRDNPCNHVWLPLLCRSCTTAARWRSCGRL